MTPTRITTTTARAMWLLIAVALLVIVCYQFLARPAQGETLPPTLYGVLGPVVGQVEPDYISTYEYADGERVPADFEVNEYIFGAYAWLRSWWATPCAEQNRDRYGMSPSTQQYFAVPLVVTHVHGNALILRRADTRRLDLTPAIGTWRHTDALGTDWIVHLRPGGVCEIEGLTKLFPDPRRWLRFEDGAILFPSPTACLDAAPVRRLGACRCTLSRDGTTYAGTDELGRSVRAVRH